MGYARNEENLKPAYQNNLIMYNTTGKLKKVVTEMLIRYASFDNYKAVCVIFHTLKELYHYQRAYNKDSKQDLTIMTELDRLNLELKHLGILSSSQNIADKKKVYIALRQLEKPITEVKIEIYAFMAKNHMELFMQEEKDPMRAITRGYN